MAGDGKIEVVINKTKTILIVCRVEINKFHFSGWDIERDGEGNIIIMMEEYANTIKEIETFRKDKGYSRFDNKN